MNSFIELMRTLDPTYLSAWASAGSSIVSLALLLTTIWLALLTKTLAVETKRARVQNESAQVDCSVQHHPRSISFLQLVILNSGKASARDVLVEVNRGGHFHSTEKPRFPFSALIPGEQREIFVGSYIQMKEKMLKVTVSYTDKTGEHTFTYEQDFEVWNDMAQVGRNPVEDVADHLKKIEATLDNLTRSKRLRVNVISDAALRLEEKEWSEQVEAARARRAGLSPPVANEDGTKVD